MPFTRPTLQEIVDRIEQDLLSRIESSSTLLRRAVLKVISRVYAGAAHLLYGYLSYIKDQIFVSSSDEENLEIAGGELGIIKKAAEYAHGTVIATGTSGVTIPAKAVIQFPDNQQYTVDSAAYITLGIAYLDITAVVPGIEGNQNNGMVGTFVSPIVGVNSSVTVDADGIIDGSDTESVDALRNRVLLRKSLPPQGGAHNDYEMWALEIPGVTRAWTLESYMGPGTVGLAFVRDNDPSIIPTEVQMEEMYAYLVSHTDNITGQVLGKPVTAKLFIVDLSLYTLNFIIRLLPNTPTVQSLVADKLTQLINTSGGPDVPLYETDFDVAISQASGHITHAVDFPVGDFGCPVNRVPVMGTITFLEYA